VGINLLIAHEFFILDNSIYFDVTSAGEEEKKNKQEKSLMYSD
jgi:hypothetical protein